MWHTGDIMAPITIQTGDSSCRLWLENTPRFSGYTTACLGDFKAQDLAQGKALVAALLDHLRGLDIEYLIGPMNGNTWHSYRVAVGSAHIPPFLMEPQNPAFYPTIFEQTGFDVIGRYCSGLADLSTISAETYMPEDLYIRTFNPDDAACDLEKIYHLSLQAFSGNFLYTGLEKSEFMSLYQPLLAHMNPDFVLMTEDSDGDLQGFLFAIPNFAQGVSPDQIIVKTYASLKKGVGRLMIDHLHAKARDAGFRSVIHALMHDDNVSRQRSLKYGVLFREYYLYGRKVII